MLINIRVHLIQPRLSKYCVIALEWKNMEGNIFRREILKLQASGIYNMVHFLLGTICKFDVIWRGLLGSQAIVLNKLFIDKVVGSSTV